MDKENNYKFQFEVSPETGWNILQVYMKQSENWDECENNSIYAILIDMDV